MCVCVLIMYEYVATGTSQTEALNGQPIVLLLTLHDQVVFVHVCMYLTQSFCMSRKALYTSSELCIHTYIHTYIPTYIHICIHTQDIGTGTGEMVGRALLDVVRVCPPAEHWIPLVDSQGVSVGSGRGAVVHLRVWYGQSKGGQMQSEAARKAAEMVCACVCVCVCVCMYVSQMQSEAARKAAEMVRACVCVCIWL